MIWDCLDESVTKPVDKSAVKRYNKLATELYGVDAIIKKFSKPYIFSRYPDKTHKYNIFSAMFGDSMIKEIDLDFIGVMLDGFK